MKAMNFIYLSVLCLVSIMFISCSDDETENVLNSYPPVYAEVILVDDDGNNLLTEATIETARSNISVIHKGSTAKIDYHKNLQYMPNFTVYSRILPNGEYSFYWPLCIWDTEDMEYIIDYGNGKQVKLEYSVKYPKCVVKVNGAIQSDINAIDDVDRLITLKLNPNK